MLQIYFPFTIGIKKDIESNAFLNWGLAPCTVLLRYIVAGIISKNLTRNSSQNSQEITWYGVILSVTFRNFSKQLFCKTPLESCFWIMSIHCMAFFLWWVRQCAISEVFGFINWPRDIEVLNLLNLVSVFSSLKSRFILMSSKHFWDSSRFSLLCTLSK